MTKSMGRPEKEFKWEVMDAVLQYGASLIDCSEFLGLSEDTIQRRIGKDFGMTFREYRNKKMGKMRMKLLQKQFELAMNGSVPLLIWMGKQHLGQSEKTEVRDTTLSYTLNYKVEDEPEKSQN